MSYQIGSCVNSGCTFTVSVFVAFVSCFLHRLFGGVGEQVDAIGGEIGGQTSVQNEWVKG